MNCRRKLKQLKIVMEIIPLKWNLYKTDTKLKLMASTSLSPLMLWAGTGEVPNVTQKQTGPRSRIWVLELVSGTQGSGSKAEWTESSLNVNHWIRRAWPPAFWWLWCMWNRIPPWSLQGHLSCPLLPTGVAFFFLKLQCSTQDLAAILVLRTWGANLSNSFSDWQNIKNAMIYWVPN